MSTPGREVGKRENESKNNWHIGEKKVVKWKGCWYEKQSKTYILSYVILMIILIFHMSC